MADLSDVRFRPMRGEDVAAAERLSAESFHELDVRSLRAGDPAPERRPPERAASWAARTHHLLTTDPGGCWVAEDAGDLLGVATSFNREKLWCLATYAVRPGLQGRGLGKALLAAALHHGRGSLRGMVSSSSDPRAVRRYRLAGFSLHPQMAATGTVDRAAIPVVEKVRGGRRRRRRPDGLRRPGDPRRRARTGPRADAAVLAAAGLRHHDRVGLRLPRGRAGRAAGRHEPAYGDPAAVGRARRRRAAGDRPAPHAPRTSGHSTSRSRPGSTSAPRGTWRCGGWRRPRRTCTTARCCSRRPAA